MNGVTQAANLWRRTTIALTIALILLLLLWQLAPGFSWSRLGITLLLAIPLLAPLTGLIRSQRRTYAWATLCVIPYFIVGITESIANPHSRGWSGSCLALSLFLFVSLIAYLRVTRPSA